MSDYKKFFGEYGGRFVPEPLVPVLEEIEKAFLEAIADKSFQDELLYYQRTFIGRPTPLYFAENITKALGGADVYFKCEGLAQTGAHKINNALGQCMLARRMGKTKVIAETGAGQHGVATAVAAAKLGLECKIFQGATDVKRQRPNVFNMNMFGADVIPVESGQKSLTDAVDAALAYWVENFKDTYYVLGSAVGPAPYPYMVREFQSIIGKEVKVQSAEAGLDIEAIVAAVGGGSNAMGIFSTFVQDAKPRLIGVEAGGRSDNRGDNAKRLAANSKSETGTHHGFKSKFILNSDGSAGETHSISAGLDYPGVGPEVTYLNQIGRIDMVSATDDEVMDALQFAAGHEGILFALESAHALAHALKIAPFIEKGKAVIVNMSGRGDKDIFITAKIIDKQGWIEFLKHEIEDCN